MKQVSRFLVVAAAAFSTSFFGSTTFAQHGGGGFGGGHGGGGGGFHTQGGFHGGGGWHGGGWGWRGYYPWGFSFAYVTSPYYYYPYYYYDYPPATYYPPTYYSSPPVYNSTATYDSDPPAPAPKVIEVPQQQPFERPASQTTGDRDTSSPPTSNVRGGQGQPTSVADVKSLAKAGLSDEVILSHIRNSQDGLSLDHRRYHRSQE